ncbi:probable 28S ribosomal protein S10, mitochondrial isoform X2 [Aplysia californica]|uniref:Small ribosomal subunit protein uS10m n=1 Tax=Aplysia californica TaxID=6500 RepID=A0ABM1A290_APLCA|nr:probable 28S ribosomal protein S10, mitochondrial isoform X2 [Aplysia californica]
MASRMVRTFKFPNLMVNKVRNTPSDLNKFQCMSVVPRFSTQTVPEKKATDDGQKDELYRQITVEVKGHDPAVMKSYEKFTRMAASGLGVDIAKIFEPPRVITRLSLLKSVFVHKKHFHQYEARTLYKVIEHELHPLPGHLKPPSSSRMNADTPSLSSTEFLESNNVSSLSSASVPSSASSVQPDVKL